MKRKFRMYQRGLNGRFYIQDNTTGKQESLGTSDRTEALRLFHARNEAEYQPAFNVHWLARISWPRTRLSASALGSLSWTK